MKKGVISFPPTSENRSNQPTYRVALGIKLTDDKIIRGLSIKTVAAIILLCIIFSSIYKK